MIGLVSEFPNIGIPLRGQWAGARRVHFANDKYRLIWKPIDDLEMVQVLLVGPKQDAHGTIYDRPRPDD
jgi:hypothetical protein